MSDEQHARYLQDPDTGIVQLVVADQVEEKRKVGWKDPEGIRGNGYTYNRPEDQLNIDAAGEVLKAKTEYKAHKADEKTKENEDARLKSEAAQRDALAKQDEPKKENFFQRLEDEFERK